MESQSHLNPESEVAASLVYMGKFLEQFNEFQVVALTFPLEELETFFSQLYTVLNIIRKKTGFAFAPIIL